MIYGGKPRVVRGPFLCDDLLLSSGYQRDRDVARRKDSLNAGRRCIAKSGREAYEGVKCRPKAHAEE
jgi:hypothetical protein